MMSLESVLRLGWAFARTIVKNRLVSGSDLARVVAQYRPEGMLSHRPEDHGVMVRASACTGCGRCDVKALSEGTFEALGPRGPMAFVVGASRQSGLDASFSARATEAVLAGFTEVCPVGVDFVPLAAMVRRRHGELAAAIRVDAVKV